LQEVSQTKSTLKGKLAKLTQNI